MIDEGAGFSFILITCSDAVLKLRCDHQITPTTIPVLDIIMLDGYNFEFTSWCKWQGRGVWLFILTLKCIMGGGFTWTKDFIFRVSC